MWAASSRYPRMRPGTGPSVPGRTYAGGMDPRTRRFVTLAVLVSLTVVVVIAALRG